MKIDPPPATRLKIPINPPPPPPNPAVVCMSMVWLIHDSSPETETTLSPGCNVTSRTGSVVPRIRWFMPRSSRKPRPPSSLNFPPRSVWTAAA